MTNNAPLSAAPVLMECDGGYWLVVASDDLSEGCTAFVVDLKSRVMQMGGAYVDILEMPPLYTGRPATITIGRVGSAGRPLKIPTVVAVYRY